MQQNMQPTVVIGT